MLEVWLKKVKQYISENDHEDRPQCFIYKDYEICTTAMWKTSGEKYYLVQINKEGREVSRQINDFGDSRDTVEMLARIWVDDYGQL